MCIVLYLLFATYAILTHPYSHHVLSAAVSCCHHVDFCLNVSMFATEKKKSVIDFYDHVNVLGAK